MLLDFEDWLKQQLSLSVPVAPLISEIEYEVGNFFCSCLDMVCVGSRVIGGLRALGVYPHYSQCLVADFFVF